MVKITVDQSKCIGCGACAATCPESFKLDNGKARAIKAEVKEVSCEKVAASGCPVAAISVA